MLKVGDKAPDIRLPDQDGKPHALKEFLGKWILLYFYPKDNTPGCTREACELRDAMPKFKKLGVVVLGVSVDSVQSHGKFARKYHLPFLLLSDDGKATVKAYGVWGKKKFMGHEYTGTKRWSFLIAPKGKIIKIYDHVKPAEHARQVLEDLKTLAAK